MSINPVNGTVSNKSYSPAQAVPTDFRSQFYDASNFVMRDYQNTAEVISYLNLSKYRFGHFPIYIHSGGSLSAGVWTGGTTEQWWFKDGIADGDLVIVFNAGTFVPTNRTITINGVLFDLSVDRTWTIATGYPDDSQVYTTGSTVTIADNKNIIQINPASVISALTITLPATAHPTKEIGFYFGGTIASGNVITSLTLNGNSGQTIIIGGSIGSVVAGEYISFKQIGSIWYRKT